MQRIFTILVVFAWVLPLIKAQNCQECQAANNVYCHNQTSYQNCMRGAPFGDMQHCLSDTVCSNSNEPCQVITTANPDIKDVCGSTGANGAGCGVCDGTGKYTCVSSTQFARCSGTTLIDSFVYKCEHGELCNLSALEPHQTVCVPSCVLEFLDAKATCSNSEFTTTTTTVAPTTTPSPEARRTKCSEAATASGTTGKFFYTKYTEDPTCRSYLYCQREGVAPDYDYTTVFLTCKSPKIYFDSITSACSATKPADCT